MEWWRPAVAMRHASKSRSAGGCDSFSGGFRGRKARGSRSGTAGSGGTDDGGGAGAVVGVGAGAGRRAIARRSASV
jgi:hypothetical protein